MPPLENTDPIVLRSAESETFTPGPRRTGGRLPSQEFLDKQPNRAVLVLGVLCALLFVTGILLVGRLHSANGAKNAMEKKLRGAEETLYKVQEENARLSEKMVSLENAVDVAKRENASLAASLKKIEDRMKDVQEEKVYLEDILIHKTKEIERLKTGGVPTDAAITDKDAEIARLAEQNRVLSAKLEKLYQAANEKISEINVAKIALEETIAEAKKQVQDEYSTVDLGAIHLDATARPHAPSVPLAQPAPSSVGRVRAINDEHGFVVIDMGKAQRVKPDSILEVTRGGKRVAMLSVLEIRDVMSACNIKESARGESIQVGDTVTLRK
jgi:predicted  nucleic acid-binding Zn-ribbon protein